MRLYTGHSSDFIESTARNEIATKLKDNFFKHFRYNPSDNEVRSWQNSLRAIADVFRLAELDDHGVILEYQLPLTSKRLDCLLCGKSSQGTDNAIVVELKQWDECSDSDADNLVTTWVAGAKREVLHPSAQVRGYRDYLRDTHTSFYKGPDHIGLDACSYLHNYHPKKHEILRQPKFTAITQDAPLFFADETRALETYLKERVPAGKGMEVVRKIDQGHYRPSKKLMHHVGEVIRGKPEYVLLDEQRVIYEKVLAVAKKAVEAFNGRKHVVLVNGGPGTGKSIVALNLMADLSLKKINAHYATGSKAFTETLRKVIGPRGSIQFKYFNSYMNADDSIVDVLICDEAHRIREASHNQYTPAANRTNKPQIQEIIEASKVSVFFIDDNQVVRPNEVGSASLVREFSNKMGCELSEFRLETQFRCAGSNGFVNWINNTLGVMDTANVIWTGDKNFEFKIFSSPNELEKAIKDKASSGFSARMAAGFCWPWSKRLGDDGQLVNDVSIPEYNYFRPWNAQHDATRLPRGIPKAHLWAHEPGGLEQVGCVYTAQGFEFDYVGVIFGKDLKYDFDAQQWIGDKTQSYDNVVKRSKDQFVDLVKATYRILLSRGMKGCYVCFLDKDTERFFKSRMQKEASDNVVELYPAHEVPSLDELPMAAEPPNDSESDV